MAHRWVGKILFVINKYKYYLKKIIIFSDFSHQSIRGGKTMWVNAWFHLDKLTNGI